MTESENKELKVREKQEVAGSAEQTTPGPVFSPAVDIFENGDKITLLADMPGVNADDLTIDLRDNTLTLSADVAAAGNNDEQELLTEYQTGRYYRQFTVGEVIDQGKIGAELTNGVLRLTLPKIEKATPKKITVKTS